MKNTFIGKERDDYKRHRLGLCNLILKGEDICLLLLLAQIKTEKDVVKLFLERKSERERTRTEHSVGWSQVQEGTLEVVSLCVCVDRGMECVCVLSGHVRALVACSFNTPSLASGVLGGCLFFMWATLRPVNTAGMITVVLTQLLRGTPL